MLTHQIKLACTNPRNSRLRLCLGLLCLGFCGGVYGQGYSVFNFDELSGLSNSLVKAVAEDEQGFVWLGTDGGLIRYDGQAFRTYEDLLPAQYVKDLLRTEDGLIVSTDEGLFLLHPHPSKPSVERLFGNAGIRLTKKLFTDSQGRLWFSNNGNIFRSAAGGLKVYTFDEPYHSTDFLRSFTIIEDHQGQLYAFSKTGALFAYDEDNDRFMPPLHQLAHGISHALFVAPGKIWAATYGGIFEIEVSPEQTLAAVHQRYSFNAISLALLPEGGVAAAVRNDRIYMLQPERGTARPITEQAMPNTFTSLYLSEDRSLWASTDNGISLLKPHQLRCVYPDQLGKRYIQAVAEWRQALYISDGRSIYLGQLDGSGGLRAFHFAPFDVYCMRPQAEGLWIAGSEGKAACIGWDGELLRQYDLSAYGDALYQVAADDAGQLWFCQARSKGLIRLSANGQVRQYGQAQGLTADELDAVAFDTVSGTLYAGGQHASRLLFRYAPKHDRFENISLPVEVDTEQTFRLIDLAPDGSGGLLMGTSLGLFHYRQAQLRLVKPSATRGVSVQAVTKGKDGAIWFATANGLNLLTDSSLLTFTELHGLPARLVNWRSLLTDSQGNVWAATPLGLACAPAHLAIQTTLPPLFLNLESSNGVRFERDLKNIYASTNDYLAIQFLSLGYPGMMMNYRRTLKYRDTVEQSISKAPILRFSKLTLGPMEVEISARQSTAHQWSEPLTFRVNVLPPWYQRWYGLLGIALGSIALAWLVQRLWQRYFEHRSKELSDYNQALEEQVQAGIQDYQMLVDHIGDSVLKVTLDGQVLYTSPSWLDNYGYSAAETQGHSLSLFLHPEDIAESMQKLAQLGKGSNKSAVKLEHRFKNRDGEWRWAETKGVFAPQAQEVVLISRDITERRESEQRLRYLTAMQKILMSISHQYINLPLNEVEVAINTSLQEMGEFVNADRVYIFDYDFEHHQASNTYEWCRKGTTPQIEHLQSMPLNRLTADWVDTHRQGKPMHIPNVYALPKSRMRYLLERRNIKSLLAVPLMQGEHCLGFVGFDSVRSYHEYVEKEITLLGLFAQMLVNIRIRTERQRELQQLLDTTTDQNNRLKEFSFMVSHNIRSSAANLLALIGMVRLAPENTAYFDMLHSTAKRLDTTLNNINHLLHFEREVNTQELSDCNVLETIKQVLALNSKPVHEQQARVQLQVPDNLSLRAVPAYLDSILHNLLSNALKYGVTSESKLIEIGALQNGGEVVIWVKDYGLGMDLERFGDKLFRLGSRLHALSADGQGMGLYMTKSQVEGMGGRIEVDSQPGKGTTFRIYFPSQLSLG